jgi:hypothetical protein
MPQDLAQAARLLKYERHRGTRRAAGSPSRTALPAVPGAPPHGGVGAVRAGPCGHWAFREGRRVGAPDRRGRKAAIVARGHRRRTAAIVAGEPDRLAAINRSRPVMLVRSG